MNPDAKRYDTWIDSFDKSSSEWSNKFLILYSNSFDQSQEPILTADEWKRALQGGCGINYRL